jgi:hypothetical protein
MTNHECNHELQSGSEANLKLSPSHSFPPVPVTKVKWNL